MAASRVYRENVSRYMAVAGSVTGSGEFCNFSVSGVDMSTAYVMKNVRDPFFRFL